MEIKLNQTNWDMVVTNVGNKVENIEEFVPEDLIKTTLNRFKKQIELEYILNQLLIQYKTLMQVEVKRMREAAQKKVDEDHTLSGQIEINTMNMRFNP